MAQRPRWALEGLSVRKIAQPLGLRRPMPRPYLAAPPPPRPRRPQPPRPRAPCQDARTRLVARDPPGAAGGRRRAAQVGAPLGGRPAPAGALPRPRSARASASQPPPASHARAPGAMAALWLRAPPRVPALAWRWAQVIAAGGLGSCPTRRGRPPGPAVSCMPVTFSRAPRKHAARPPGSPRAWSGPRPWDAAPHPFWRCCGPATFLPAPAMGPHPRQRGRWRKAPATPSDTTSGRGGPAGPSPISRPKPTRGARRWPRAGATRPPASRPASGVPPRPGAPARRGYRRAVRRPKPPCLRLSPCGVMASPIRDRRGGLAQGAPSQPTPTRAPATSRTRPGPPTSGAGSAPHASNSPRPAPPRPRPPAALGTPRRGPP